MLILSEIKLIIATIFNLHFVCAMCVMSFLLYGNSKMHFTPKRAPMMEISVQKRSQIKIRKETKDSKAYNSQT